MLDQHCHSGRILCYVPHNIIGACHNELCKLLLLKWRRIYSVDWCVIKHMGQNHPIQTPDKTSQKFVLGKDVLYAMFLWLLCILMNYSLNVRKCWVHGGLGTSLDMLMLWGKKCKPSSLGEWNLEFLSCATTSELNYQKTARPQNPLYAQVMLNS